MTRDELVATLNGIFATYGIPVARDPGVALVVPGIQVAAGSPYRARAQMCWTKTWEITVVAGRMDDAAVYDTCDTLADVLLDGLDGFAGLANQGAGAAPGPFTVGDVDCLAVTFTVTDFNL